MCSSVDLPVPDGPTRAAMRARRQGEVDALQHVEHGLALDEAPADALAAPGPAPPHS